MAKIEFCDVSVTYTMSTQLQVFRLYEVRKETLQEDLPQKNIEGTLALEDVNLVVLDGETLVVLGPSGSGKSTLLRVASGLINDYSGKVLYDGEDVTEIEPKDRYIGMVFQNFALYPHFNNQGNLSLFFKLNKINDEETRARIQYTADLMGIGFNDLLPRKPGTLSGGEKQRVAIARAIVRRPKLFLMDEPLSSLDAKLRAQTRIEIKRLLRKFGITTIYVTHDQVEAIALADRIVIMRAGKIEQVGTYSELMRSPANSFVAGFFGTPPMCLLEGCKVDGEQLFIGSQALDLPGNIRERIRPGQIVTLGFRSENVEITTSMPATDRIFLTGVVDALEADFVNHAQRVYANTDGKTFSGIYGSMTGPGVGEMVHAIIDPEALYYFDEATGLRL
jgi:ABC-type sugar transport system ATPase subunit